MRVEVGGEQRREAIVLAGGRGSRLSSVVQDVPKPLASVAGRPFLRFVLDHLHSQGFDRVVLAVGYGQRLIKGYFGNVYRGMEIVYSAEDAPLFTGGAVKLAMRYCEGPWVCVVNGDTFLDIDYSTLYHAAVHSDVETQCVIAVRRMDDASRYGTLEVTSSGMVVGFREKLIGSRGLVNAGIYLMKKEALDGMPARFSLENDYFEVKVAEKAIKAVMCDGLFIDIGIPEDYWRAQLVMKPYAKRWRLALFDRDGTINLDVGHLSEPERLVLIEETVEIIRRFNANPGWKVAVVTNQAGIAKGLYGEAEMRALHREMDRRLAKHGARIDAYYHCPHHPEFTGPCSCRKPLPGMLEKALFDFDADPSESVMFGDKNTDAEAALAAGVAFEYAGETVRLMADETRKGAAG